MKSIREIKALLVGCFYGVVFIAQMIGWTIMNVSFCYAVTKKVISNNPVESVNLPKADRLQKKLGFHTRNIDTTKTLTLEQIHLLLEKSKNTPIYMQVLFNVLMGLRRSEINGLKYSVYGDNQNIIADGVPEIA